MRIGLTGATGFVGRNAARLFLQSGHTIRAWYRSSSSGKRFEGPEWIEGELGNLTACRDLVGGCDVVVHSALYREGSDWSGSGNFIEFLRKNFMGSIELMEEAAKAGVMKFIFISSCAVHDKILLDRPLDETHPLFPASHYGAHKAALEAFVHSFAQRNELNICAIRPTGIYGLDEPVQESKWFDLVRRVLTGPEVECERGGKEVHVSDVGRAIELLIRMPDTKGEIYNCYDRYISDWEVASLAKELSGAPCAIRGQETTPKNQISNEKLRSLGFLFGGTALLRRTVEQLVAAADGMA